MSLEDAVHTFRLAVTSRVLDWLGDPLKKVYNSFIGSKGTGRSIMNLGRNVPRKPLSQEHLSQSESMLRSWRFFSGASS